MGIEIAAGAVLISVAAIWAILTSCTGQIPIRVAEADGYLNRGQLTLAEPLVLAAIKEDSRCECVKRLATRYYRMLLDEAIRLSQMEKAEAARVSCVTHATAWEFFVPISPERVSAKGYCETAILMALVLKQGSEKEKSGRKGRPRKVPTPESLPDVLEKQGIPDPAELDLLPRQPQHELGEGETGQVSDKRGKGLGGMEVEDACRTPPTKGREEPVAGCPGAPPPVAKPSPHASARHLPEPRRTPASRKP